MNSEYLKLVLKDAQSTWQLGAAVGQATKDSALVALVGPLGAGKTVFAKGVGAGLGVKEQVVSPTFTMLNEYVSGRIPLYHLDLYRLHNEANAAALLDSLQIEITEIVLRPGLVLIEWANFIVGFLQSYDHLRLNFNYGDPTENVRIATLRTQGTSSFQLASKLSQMFNFSKSNQALF